MEDEEFIRVYMDGGHIPGIPGFFPAGVPVRIDERTNTVLPNESPPALDPSSEEETEEQEEQPSQSEQAASSDSEQQSTENVTTDTNQEQGEALPVNPLLNLGMLGGNS